MKKLLNLTCLAILAALVTVGCSVEEAGPDGGTSVTGENGSGNGESGQLQGTVKIDGSSTVFPISQAVAEEFQKQYPRVKVAVGTSGTGGGFGEFIRGVTDINDASRPIKESEKKSCREAGIEYVELKIAIDGLSVIVNPQNDWCDCLSVEQLAAIWKPGSQVTNWSDVDPSWPKEPIKLYGPDTDSGTFDYFTEEICGKSGASRSDYTPSTDDNVLVRGVAGDKYSLGYFGYAYYVENQDKLKVLGVAPGSDKAGCVKPSEKTIEGGQYTPLSRPLFLYVNKESLKKPHVVKFLNYYLSEGQELVGEVGYVRLSETVSQQAQKTLDDALADIQ